jgi:integrase
LYDSLLRNHILPSFAETALADITTRLVRHWHARMLAADRPGAVTVAKTYRLLRSILATAVEDGLIVKNPCVIKGAGVERSPERPVATIEQVYALAETIDPRYRMLILLATFASMRFGELAALKRSHIDVATGLITVKAAATELNDGTRSVGRPKTDAGRRTVAVPPVLLDELRTHLDTYAQPGPDGLAFVGPAGGPLRRSNWAKTWRPIAARLNLHHLHFHDLRHTGNTLAAATGASTKELMSRMGHSSSRAALHYQHATSERELAIAQRLGEMVSAARRRVASETSQVPLVGLEHPVSPEAARL